MASLEFDAVNKTYDKQSWALRDLSLSVADGEFLVLVGPSGCGKTTALRMLAGFEEVTAGEIRIDGTRVNETPPRDRDIAMVFQNYALYPHMNVYDNIAYGLKVRRIPKAERRARVGKAAAMLGLTDELDRKPSQLSGGQRQRVAMGRAIVREPRAFLMDEPLSNLDARLRVRMRTEIANLQRELNVTTVYVTHDQIEAMTMADRVAIMSGGLLQQIDTPQRVYSDPVNLFVATFIGSPAMNILEGELVSVGDHAECRIGGYTIPLPAHRLSEHPALRAAVGQTVAVGIRPNAIAVSRAPDADGMAGTVAVAEELGSEVLAHIEIAAKQVNHQQRAEDTDLALLGSSSADGPTAVVVASLPGESPIRRKDHVTVRFDVDRMHFFDIETGATLSRRTDSPHDALSRLTLLRTS
jgi:ABC-type sugar transport system ATPase subunit